MSDLGLDTSVVAEIVSELERRGIACWLAARDARPGAPLNAQIADALDACRAILLIMSERDSRGDDVRREIANAGDACKVILPFRVDDLRSKRGASVRLSDLHWIDAFAARERKVDELIDTLQPARSRRPPPAPVIAAGEPPPPEPEPYRPARAPALEPVAKAPIRLTASRDRPRPPDDRSRARASERANARANARSTARQSLAVVRRLAAATFGAVAAVAVCAVALGIMTQSPPASSTTASIPPPAAAAVDEPAPSTAARAEAPLQRPAWLEAQVETAPTSNALPFAQSAARAPQTDMPALFAAMTYSTQAAAKPAAAGAPSTAATGQIQSTAAAASSTAACMKKPVAHETLATRAAKPLAPGEECALKPKDTFKECANCPVMVFVPSGAFRMGSPNGSTNQSPQHDVNIGQAFAVGEFAVTFEEWDACVKEGGCNGYSPPDEGWGRGQRPVINVSWNDAKAYVAWLSRKTGKPYRLLTEAEREYVTRAGSKTPFWWGASVSTKQANYDGTIEAAASDNVRAEPGEHRQKTLPVNSFAANPFGLYQVHGNVFEWTEDCYHVGYSGAPADGSAWVKGADCEGDGHIVRGGSWDQAWTFARAEFRGRSAERSNIVGLRVARTLQPPGKSDGSVVASAPNGRPQDF